MERKWTKRSRLHTPSNGHIKADDGKYLKAKVAGTTMGFAPERLLDFIAGSVHLP